MRWNISIALRKAFAGLWERERVRRRRELRRKIWLYKPRLTRGGLVAVLTTGAYNYSMDSNYNRVPRFPLVMLRGGNSYVAVRRETYEDLLLCDQ